MKLLGCFFHFYVNRKIINFVNNIQEQFELDVYQILPLAASFAEVSASFLLFHAVMKKYFPALFVVMFEVVSKPIIN